MEESEGRLSALDMTFYILGAGSLLSGVMVVASNRSVYSALALVFNFLCLAGLYITLYAHFIAALQVMVYAGAIMVLFLFVVMLIQVRNEGKELDRLTLQKPVAILFVLALLGQGFFSMRSAIANLRPPDQSVPRNFGGIEEVGRDIFTTHLLPFELTSVLLLVAVVGAVVLAKRTRMEAGSE